MVIRKLIVDNGRLHIEILPEFGGKLSSLRFNGGPELLQAPLCPYAPRNREMAFDEGDASGFDECLPSVSACIVESPSGPAHIPDHGDFWRIPWQAEQTASDIRLSAHGFSLPLKFEKLLRLEDSSLHIAYRVTNTGPHTVDYAWSAHPLFAVDPGDRIVLPSTVEVSVEGSAGQRLGASGTRHRWPFATAPDGQQIDLSIAQSVDSGIGDKLYAAAPPEGWCALERLRLNCRIAVHFGPTAIPFLGLWLCYGGWPETGAARQQCVALEPCTAPVDSLAEASAKGRARTLSPGATDNWQVEIRLTGVS